MHRNYLSFFLFVLTGLMVTSCEVPVEIEGDSQIIVQSRFSNDQDLIVYVIESNNRDADTTGRYVENASVALYNGDDLEFITTLQLCKKPNESFYTTINFLPEINNEYLLNVDVPGYSPIYATNSIPDSVSSLAEIGNAATVVDNGISTVDFELTLTIDDPSNDDNYYHILFFQELISSSIGFDGEMVRDTILMDKESLFIETRTKTIDIKQIFNDPSFILNDELFNGEQVHIRFNGHYDYDQTLYTQGEFLIEIRNVSKAYYDLMDNLSTKPPGTISEDYYTGNVTNAGGFFLGYSTTFKRLRF